MKKIFSGEIKLCDFGESRLLDDSFVSTRVGTIVYWSPEHFSQDQDKPKYDIRSDIWSLGVTLSEVCMGRLPYLSHRNEDIHPFTIMARILNADFTTITNSHIRPMEFSDNLCELIILLCTKNVDERPNLLQLKTDDTYQGHQNISKEEISSVLRKYQTTP